MATRQSVENCLQQCEEVLRIASDEYTQGAKQEHYNNESYIEAQGLLQTAANEIETLVASGNLQQREQLKLMRNQIQQMQHNMIVLNH